MQCASGRGEKIARLWRLINGRRSVGVDEGGAKASLDVEVGAARDALTRKAALATVKPPHLCQRSELGSSAADGSNHGCSRAVRRTGNRRRTVVGMAAAARNIARHRRPTTPRRHARRQRQKRRFVRRRWIDSFRIVDAHCLDKDCHKRATLDTSR
uniref:Uncharacterized protein n=1 Tax=Plectus sambesii TaxID=2011161 RepID=A0A914WLW1_9BILA